ncbi:XRE family transcriptional regulator [Luteimonas saliphila]|uniref:XRE family transcriptional regulator n=1 Tax=Luteimonas saliphila TaxID=2804919 RepID=UPI00192E0C34|nr:S24 family peptidase [Luteimonas saliphila]
MIGTRLKELRKGAGLNQEAFGAIAGTTKQYVSQLESGVNKTPNGDFLESWARHFGVRMQWLTKGKGPKLEDQTSSNEDWRDIRATIQGASMGAGMSPDDYAETHHLKFRASSLQRKGLRPPSLEVYYGRGDSMEPRIKDGDAVLVDKTDTRIVDDRIYFIRHEHHYFVKRLQKHGDLTLILSDNKDDPQWRKPVLVKDSDDFEVLGRVRWIGSWED